MSFKISYVDFYEQVDAFYITAIIVAVMSVLLTLLFEIYFKYDFQKQEPVKFAQKHFIKNYPKIICTGIEKREKIDTTSHGDQFCIQDVDLVNMNFLNMLNNKRLKEIAVNSIKEFGLNVQESRHVFGRY